MARILYVPALRAASIAEAPCVPVAPMTVRSGAIVEFPGKGFKNCSISEDLEKRLDLSR